MLKTRTLFEILYNEKLDHSFFHPGRLKLYPLERLYLGVIDTAKDSTTALDFRAVISSPCTKLHHSPFPSISSESISGQYIPPRQQFERLFQKD